MKDLDVLQEYGLTQVGTWELSTSYASTPHLKHLPSIEFKLIREFEAKAHIVYSFVIGDKVAYVGETSKGLRERFGGYRYGNTNPKDTDNQVKKWITESLNTGAIASIWACAPVAIMKLQKGNCEIPASKPVEEILIQRLNPEFNRKNIGTVGNDII